MISQIETHNNDRSESENAMNSLTLRASSGTRATLSLSEDHEIAAEAEVPREFCAPCPKLLGAAIKSGKEVPVVKTKRKANLSITTKIFENRKTVVQGKRVSDSLEHDG